VLDKVEIRLAYFLFEFFKHDYQSVM
jgi:hypothetical protein